MIDDSSIRACATRAICGLLLVVAWLLSPAFHLLEQTGRDAAKHHHDESSCPICQIAAHGAVVSAGGAPVVASVVLHDFPYLRPEIVSVSFPPDVRAHGSRGPPSA